MTRSATSALRGPAGDVPERASDRLLSTASAAASSWRSLQEDYILVARAKGLPTGYILLRHVLRPALPQVLTVMGLSMTYLLGGSFIVESYFAVPGIGWTVLSAVNSHDFPRHAGDPFADGRRSSW